MWGWEQGLRYPKLNRKRWVGGSKYIENVLDGGDLMRKIITKKKSWRLNVVSTITSPVVGS